MSDYYNNDKLLELEAAYETERQDRLRLQDRFIEMERENAQQRNRCKELERRSRTRSDYDLRCGECGAPHWIDTSLPSDVWNRIANPEDVLCMLCIDERLAEAGIECEAEFYFAGKALKSKLYENSHGDIEYLKRENEQQQNRITSQQCMLRMVKHELWRLAKAGANAKPMDSVILLLEEWTAPNVEEEK